MSVAHVAPYRPWGRLPWLLKQLGTEEWTLLGSLSPEERCLTTLREMRGSNHLGAHQLLRIEPSPVRAPQFQALADRWADRWQELYAVRRHEYLEMGGADDRIIGARLDDEAYKIKAYADSFREGCGKSVVLDISSLPKRFFFPLLRFLLADTGIENLIVVYTVAGRYADDLAADTGEWDNLPTFVNADPAWSPSQLVVGIGHHPFGLPALWSGMSNKALTLRLLMPFPPGPPHVAKNWQFVHSLVEGTNPNRFRVDAVDARDASNAFTLIAELARTGRGDLMLAPYGPKPISLAMCLFALCADAPVFYNQPGLYNPEYCSGVGSVHGHELSYGYCLRLDGRNLYSL